MKSSRLLCVILPFTSAMAFAQTPATATPAISAGTPAAAVAKAGEVAAVTATPVAAAGETSLSLDVGFGIRYVPPSRVSVPVGEVLRINGPSLGEDVHYTWTRNGRAITGATSHVLVLSHVTSEDSGVYLCIFATAGTMPSSSQALILGVGPTERLLNLSTRATLSATNPLLVSGFVVSGAREKKLIIRAVGPSLALFGETNPLRAPVLRIYDSTGALYENGHGYITVVGGPTFESDLADSSARAGAFPLSPGSRDAVDMKPFAPGSYTAQVTSADGGTGTVLLEIYEVP